MAEFNLGRVKGDKGDKGEQGVVGPQGPVGDRGPQGLQGEKGDIGQTGKEGPQGKEGKSAYEIAVINGFMGTEIEWKDSLKGEKGDIGPRGLPGSDGATGPRGETGLPGKDGLNGDKGDTGPRGLKGDIGPQGPQGIKGDTGSVGPRGSAGPSGSDANVTKVNVEAALGYSPLPVSGGVLESYTEKLNTTTGAINLNLGNVFTRNATANTTFSITDAKTNAHSFTLIIEMGATVRTLSFPASVKWQGGKIPNMTTANKTYVLTFLTTNSGATWLGMFGGEF